MRTVWGIKSWVFGKLRQTVKETKSSPQITLSGPHKKDESSKGVPFPGREGRALWPGETEPPVLTALPPPLCYQCDTERSRRIRRPGATYSDLQIQGTLRACCEPGPVPPASYSPPSHILIRTLICRVARSWPSLRLWKLNEI